MASSTTYSACGAVECGTTGITVVDSCADGSPCVKIANLYADSPVPVPETAHESNLIDQVRKLGAEFLGSIMLVNIIVGSGIMVQRLSPNDVGLQLLEHAISVAGGLLGLILMFGPVSGAHFNPVVSLVDFLHNDMNFRDLTLYTIVQISGAIIGAIIAGVQFDEYIELSTKDRNNRGHWLSEVISTVSLLMVIHGCLRTGQKTAVPYAVAAWVLAGIFFMSSSFFANPAVTIGRMFTNSFTGIDGESAGIYVAYQYLGAVIAYGLIKFFYPKDIYLKKDDNLYLRICVSNYERDKIKQA